ncbi:MAG: hypothetical protein KAI45_05275, partial [Melioribacteraceae bacterium]|nr:hypothetical protein [Melioribacteraceae bacterium]
TLLGVMFALYIDNVLHAFLFIETIAAFMGIMVFGGILWKRANRYGAFFGVSIAFILYYFINYIDSGILQIVYKWRPEPFGWAMLAGFTVFIIVSLITKAEPKEQTEEFFDKMQRLSDAEKAEKDGKKPFAREFGQELILVDLPGWFKKSRWQNFSVRYREDWRGFLLAWGFVALLVAIAWLVIQL